MPAQMLSEERIEDFSDGETDSSNSTQTLKETVKKIRQNSTSASAVDIAMENNSDDSDAESQASSTNSSVTSVSSTSKRKANDIVTTSTESVAKRAKTTGTPTKRIVSTTYVPPQGYTAANFAAHSFSSKSKGILDDLNGKQVWHISAPSSMRISMLESLDIESALKGVPILAHKDTQYILQTDSLEGQNLLLPKGTAGEYMASTCIPSRSFQIHEHAHKPNQERTHDENDDSSSPVQFFATKTGKQKPARKQPQNLNGRYVPYGASQDGVVTAIGSADTESQRSHQAEPKTPDKKPKKKRTDDMAKLSSPALFGKKSKNKAGVGAVEDSFVVTESHKKKKKDRALSSSQ